MMKGMTIYFLYSFILINEFFSVSALHSYQRLPPDNHAPPSIRSGKLVEDTQSMNGPVELVTVPALGAEWRKDELKAMTKKGKKELKEDNRWQNFRAWTRDQRGCCGKWGTRKQIAVGSFILCVVCVLNANYCCPYD